MLVTLAWLSLSLPMLIGFPFIRRAMLNEMWCDECGAKFNPNTEMPCHTDDRRIWAYKWKDEATMLEAFFPDGEWLTEGTVIDGVVMKACLACGGVCATDVYGLCAPCRIEHDHAVNRKA